MSKDLNDFLGSFQSLTINSLDEQKIPFSSYAPFVKYENSYYVYISDMAKHAQNLRLNNKCSLFFIEDESSCKNIFARKRVSMQCEAKEITKNSDFEGKVLDKFEEKFSKEMVQMLRKMNDFNVFEFNIFYGEAVFGFGQAYNLGGENFNELVQRKGTKGHGHSSK